MKWFLTLIFLFTAGFLFAGCSSFSGKAGLQVMTNDIPAGVYLDGKHLGQTPYVNKDLKPGDYSLEIRPDSTTLVPYPTKISLKKGLLTVVSWKPGNRIESSGGFIYEMEPIRNKKNSELSITTLPDGAITSVDSQPRGFSPVLIEQIAAGKHEYEISLPSYETQKNEINVIEGYRMNITVKLAKQEYIPTTASSSSSLNASGSATLASPSPSASPSKTATASSSIVPKPKVKIKSTGFMQNGKEVLRVRSTPTPGGAEVGFATVGAEYPYLKEKENGWYKISLDGKTGWVSGQYADLIE
jgi:hypothetical protein